MKFQPDSLPGTNVITRHEPGALWVGNRVFEHSVLVPWQGDVLAWPPRQLEHLSALHFDQILSLAPELVIFGSGDRLQFPSPSAYRSLIERGIGMESMDTGAACRTYNVLASEGRRVLAALLLPPKPRAAAATIISG